MKRTKYPNQIAVGLITLFIGRCWAGEGYSLDQISAETTIGLPLLSSTLSAMSTDAIDRKISNYSYAREDAAAFIASEGRIHGAQLERAWQDYHANQAEPEIALDAFAVGVLTWAE